MIARAISLFRRLWCGRLVFRASYGYGFVGPLPIFIIRDVSLRIEDQ